MNEKRNKSEDAWQILRIQGEFTKGFDTFNELDTPCISVFGSARTKVGTKWYEEAKLFGKLIACEGFWSDYWRWSWNYGRCKPWS